MDDVRFEVRAYAALQGEQRAAVSTRDSGLAARSTAACSDACSLPTVLDTADFERLRTTILVQNLDLPV